MLKEATISHHIYFSPKHEKIADEKHWWISERDSFLYIDSLEEEFG
jgi:hypothetical protein